tara:strand:+ start:74 stop:247 length:174 start_codon:yes stop_codon:yes gene_type:complete
MKEMGQNLKDAKSQSDYSKTMKQSPCPLAEAMLYSFIDNWFMDRYQTSVTTSGGASI